MEELQITPETASFIAAHRTEDVRDLALHAKRVPGLDLSFALDQIAGWQTARRKLPQWAACDGIVYPPHLSMEQCSSQFTAQYKADVARRLVAAHSHDSALSATASLSQRANTRCDASAGSVGNTGIVTPLSQRANARCDKGVGHGDDDARHGDVACGVQFGVRPGAAARPDMPTAACSDTLVDLTGGFGVDFSAMARVFAHAIYVERQPHLTALADHNFRALGLTHVQIINEAAEQWLDSAERQAQTAAFALIYLDPARRDAHGGRTYAIRDCTPDVLALKDRLLALAPHVIVKLSPMLDWRKAVEDFHGAVREVHIVSVANECKELLLVLGRPGTETADSGPRPVRVHCVNDDDRLVFDIIDGKDGGERKPVVIDDACYLYEPNASIMKAGCFRLVEERYQVSQIGPNSHLMISSEPVPDFPGRSFVIDAISGMGKKELKRALGGIKSANIAVRNFPLTAVQLRNKLKLRDGGDVYLFGTTDAAGRHVIVRAHK